MGVGVPAFAEASVGEGVGAVFETIGWVFGFEFRAKNIPLVPAIKRIAIIIGKIIRLIEKCFAGDGGGGLSKCGAV